MDANQNFVKELFPPFFFHFLFGFTFWSSELKMKENIFLEIQGVIYLILNLVIPTEGFYPEN